MKTVRRLLEELAALSEAEGDEGVRRLVRSALASHDESATEEALRELFRRGQGPENKDVQQLLHPFEQKMIAAFKGMEEPTEDTEKDSGLLVFLKGWHFNLKNVSQRAEQIPRRAGAVEHEMEQDEHGWNELATLTHHLRPEDEARRSAEYRMILFRTPAGYAVRYMGLYPNDTHMDPPITTCFSASHHFRQGFSVRQKPDPHTMPKTG